MLTNKCIDKPLANNIEYIHPLYFIRFGNPEETDIKYICPTLFYLDENYNIQLDKIVDKDTEYNSELNNNDFNIDIFLLTVYNIKTIKDAITWTKNNYTEHRLTIYRVWDLVWDSKIKKDHLDDYEILDDLINLYIELFAMKEDLKIDYKDMYDAIYETINTYLGLNYSYIGKSYQKEIKNLLQVI